jgi:hypothetical protein
MKNELDIRARIQEIRGKMDVLTSKMEEELKKQILERDHRSLMFINLQLKVYTESLAQLDWALES